jgi:PII-like signaling protein
MGSAFQKGDLYNLYKGADVSRYAHILAYAHKVEKEKLTDETFWGALIYRGWAGVDSSSKII